MVPKGCPQCGGTEFSSEDQVLVGSTFVVSDGVIEWQEVSEIWWDSSQTVRIMCMECEWDMECSDLEPFEKHLVGIPESETAKEEPNATAWM